MAYDQANYQQPQRPYNGPAAQRPRPPQGYQQPPPPQQYPPQGGYDQYAQDGYYEGYDDGYGPDYNGGGGGSYQDMNGRGNGNGYPPQNQGYGPRQGPPQGDYYPAPRGGGPMGPPNRGRGGPVQRPPTSDGVQRGYDPRVGDQGRGYPNAGPPNGGPPNGAPMGRGGRPAALDRGISSDPGARPVRKPLKTPPMSPDNVAWDNPFPTFPNSKKKTAREEEQFIIQKMAEMEVGGPPQTKGRPRGAGSQGSQNNPPGRGQSQDDFAPRARPSMDSQRSQPSRGPQGYPDQRRGPPNPEANWDAPRQQGYGGAGQDNFGPPGRSMTMPVQQAMGPPAGRQPPPPQMNPMSNERPYNGPIGRAMPPRPSTASGMRQPPQRTYPSQAPVQQNQPRQYLSDPYAPNGNPQAPRESVSDFYDAYYDTPEPPAPRHTRSQSHGSEMPNFDMVAANTRDQNPYSEPFSTVRGPSFEGNNGYRQQQQGRPMESQPDFRGRAQPQAAVFDMVGDVPAVPNQYQQGYPEDQYSSQNDPYNQQQQAPQQGYNQPPPNAFPPRSTSAAPRGGGLPNGPKGGFGGLPNGPSPNGMPRPGPDASPSNALPAHPPPVRAGLIPNSAASLASNKPMPVRNYNNVTPGAPAAQAPQPIPSAAPTGPAPVTQAEIDQLRATVKASPENQKAALTLARKLVEACDVLVPTMPDQRQRNKAREQNMLAATKLLKKLVAGQNMEAMFYLADSYGRGSLGLEPDNKEAFTLYQSAAKLGHPGAAYRTAVCCELGNEDGGGTRKDPLKAIQWYKRAAHLGDTPAMYKMGMIMLKGLLGQTKNPREAVSWLKRAAEKADVENPHALHELGLLYEAQQGPDGSIIRDEAYSFRLFQQAADLGYKFSQFRLGSAFEYGLFGLKIDPRQSIMWYSRAAVQEEHQSELALSGWYLTGSEGVLQQSDTEAYLWARKAAMAGNAKAEYAMGYFTESGIGIVANLEDAKRWYWRAAAQNFPKARERLEELKRGGKNAGMKARERVSRSNVGKQQEGECSVM